MLCLCQDKEHWQLCCPYTANTFSSVGCETTIKVITAGKKNNSTQFWITWCELEIRWRCASQTGSWSASFTLDQPPWNHFPAFPSKGAQFLSLPAVTMKKSHRWHLWSLQQSLNLTLRRPKRIEKALDRERRVSGDLQAIWFSVYPGKGMQMLIRLLGWGADVKVAFLSPSLAVPTFCTKATPVDRLRWPGISILQKDGLISAERYFKIGASLTISGLKPTSS